MVFQLRWPTEFGTITQPFGANPSWYLPFGLPGHEGLDFVAPLGSAIHACAEGVVTEIRLHGNINRLEFPYGNQVRLQHRANEGVFETIYAHLEQVTVRQNQKVQAGDIIGYADSTGNSTGSHLHLTLKLLGATEAGLTLFPRDIIDPTPFLIPFSVASTIPQDGLAYIADFSIPDGTIMHAGQIFEKTWKVRNNGALPWQPDYSLVFVSGSPLASVPEVALPYTDIHYEALLSVQMIAPSQAGQYMSNWRAQNSQGDPFGSTLFALIQVVS